MLFFEFCFVIGVFFGGLGVLICNMGSEEVNYFCLLIVVKVEFFDSGLFEYISLFEMEFRVVF